MIRTCWIGARAITSLCGTNGPTRITKAGYKVVSATRPAGRLMTLLVMAIMSLSPSLELFAGNFGKPRIAMRDNASRSSRKATELSRAATGSGSRNEAARAIPLDQLTVEFQQKITAIVRKPSVYRRLPVEFTQCDPSLYRFLIRHPEVIVNIWDLMGITKIKLKRTGPFSFQGTDGHGTTSNFELVYGSNDMHLIYGEGIYDGPLLPKPLRGRCVLFLRSEYTQPERKNISSRLDVFVQLDNAAADVIARTIHPLFGRTADVNFQQSIAFLGRVSRTAERNRAGMRRLSKRLANVDPQVRDRFDMLIDKVGQSPSQQTVVRNDATAKRG